MTGELIEDNEGFDLTCYDEQTDTIRVPFDDCEKPKRSIWKRAARTVMVSYYTVVLLSLIVGSLESTDPWMVIQVGIVALLPPLMGVAAA